MGPAKITWVQYSILLNCARFELFYKVGPVIMTKFVWCFWMIGKNLKLSQVPCLMSPLFNYHV